MPTTTTLRFAALAAVTLTLIGLVAWRAAPSAAAGELLVFRDRAHRGPIRVLTSPFAARRVVPLPLAIRLERSLDLGSGATWPLSVTAAIDIEPEVLDAAARGRLLDDTLSREVRSTLDEGLTSELGTGDRQRLLARPVALEEPLRARLSQRLGPGLRLQTLEVAVSAPPEQAQAAALSAARQHTRPPLARVLYIGLDGLDWEVLGPLMERGETPHLRALAERGVAAELMSYEPIISPLLWTTAITGRGPDDHGICDFTLHTSSQKRVPISSRFRKSPAIWEILAAAGQRSGFVNFWGTHPAEQVPGVLVSDIADRLIGEPGRPARMPASIASPSAFLDPILASLWTTETTPTEAVASYGVAFAASEIADARAYWRDPEVRRKVREAVADDEHEAKTPPAAFLLNAATGTHNLEQIALRLLADRELGVVGVYFRDPDMIGHNFQHLAPPPHPLAPPAEQKRFAGVVEASYRVMDAVVGRLVAAADSDTVVLLHSDHGFRWGARRPVNVLPFTQGQPVEWHRLQGVFLAAGGPVQRGVRTTPVSLFDITPTILALRGVPAGDNMPGEVRLDLFEPPTGAKLPQGRVPTWDPLVGPRRVEGAVEDLEATRAAMVESLKGLGYVDTGEDPGGGGPAPTPPIDATGEAPDEFPGPSYYRNLATYLIHEQRFDAAEAALLKANQVQPLPKTYWLLSETRASRGDLAGAEKALTDGFAKLPTSLDSDAVLWLTELQLRRGSASSAAETVERYRATLSREPAIEAVAEGLIAEARGDLSAARSAFQRALVADPRQTRAAERWAANARTPVERAALAPFLERALRLDSSIELYWKMLGLIASERGDMPGAAAAFRRAAELAPEDEDVQVSLSIALRRTGDNVGARRVLEALAARGTQRAPVWVNLGSLRAAVSDWRGALAAWTRARELGADSPELAAGIEEARRRGAAR